MSTVGFRAQMSQMSTSTPCDTLDTRDSLDSLDTLDTLDRVGLRKASHVEETSTRYALLPQYLRETCARPARDLSRVSTSTPIPFWALATRATRATCRGLDRRRCRHPRQVSCPFLHQHVEHVAAWSVDIARHRKGPRRLSRRSRLHPLAQAELARRGCRWSTPATPKGWASRACRVDVYTHPAPA